MKTHTTLLIRHYARALLPGGLLLLATLCALQRLPAAEKQPADMIVQAAQTFLSTLSQEQVDAVQFDFSDEEQRVRWSNLPVNMVERAGLRMGDLSASQRAAVWRLLEVSLSRKGYDKVLGIVRSDEVLKREGGNMSFGEDEFFISLLGKPSGDQPWMIQFGGHHLGLNLTIVADQGVLTPSMIAVQPARFQWNGERVEPMGRETDKALALVQSLDESQRSSAVLGFEMRDLVLGPGHDGETIQPEGIQGAALNEGQKRLLLELIAEWAELIHDSAAKSKMAEIRSHLDETWFAWSGPLERATGYFRVQGPTVMIEFAPQQLGGDVTMHLHSMFRDPTNDYGARLVEEK